MSAQGTGVKSIRKRDILGQKLPPSGQKTVVFAHEFASAGLLTLDLGALSAPASLTSQGFVQPSTAELQNANLKFYRNSLTLISSDKGVLQDYLDYNVTDNNTIEFTATFAGSVVGEIIQGIIRPLNKGASLVADVEQIDETGTLAAGDTDIQLGKSFAVNKNPNYQVGAVQVEIDGQLVYRNVGNATAAPSADGDYEEVDSGNGRSVLIRMNQADGSNDRAYRVSSTVFSVINPEGSLRDEIERQAGVLNKIKSTTAALAGVPETDLDAAPTQVQLTQFGDRLVQAEDDIETKLNATQVGDSEVRVYGGNGHGAVNTAIRRFTTQDVNIGSAITYADDADDGAVFTIQEDGIYAIYFADRRNGGQTNVGVSKNISGSDFTTNVSTVLSTTPANVLSYVQEDGAEVNGVSVITRLSAGDLIYPHTDQTNDNAGNGVMFRITQIMKL